ncbi:MAG: hypothetical protein EPO24_13200 [Bacteroidetes bacterium]|nr:MAG: hypothetical protein EPO24_13200 [Bacteroidota bacterium]
MRLTVSNIFNALAKGGSKRIRFAVKVREAASYSDELTLNNWRDVTAMINRASFPSIRHSIEYEPGQFTSSRITLESDGIQTWKTILPITQPFTLDVDAFDDATTPLG